MTAIASNAAILVEDRFIDGNFSDGADANDINWYFLDNAAAPTIQSDTTTGPNEGSADNALQGTHSGVSNFMSLGGTFASTTLAVGESLTLSFDARFTAAATSNGGGFRFGLYNTNGGTLGNGNLVLGVPDGRDDFGYLIRTPSGATAAAATLGKESGTDGIIMGGNDITTLATYTSTGLLNTSTRNFSFSVSRSSSSTLSFVYIIDGVAYSAASGALDDSSAANFTFDEIVIGTGNVAQTFRFDNLTLEYTAVPEPSSWILLGVGLVSLMFFRARKA